METLKETFKRYYILSISFCKNIDKPLDVSTPKNISFWIKIPLWVL